MPTAAQLDHSSRALPADAPRTRVAATPARSELITKEDAERGANAPVESRVDAYLPPAAPPARRGAAHVARRVYHAEPQAGRVLLGSPWTVLGSAGGTIATVAVFAASGGDAGRLAWGNTALANFQSLEVPIGTYAVGEQHQAMAWTRQLDGVPAGGRRRLPGALTALPGTDALGRGLGAVNRGVRPAALALARTLASPGAAIGALAGLGGLWLGFGLQDPTDCCDRLQVAVNAIPQYFTTPWTAATLLLIREHNDAARAFDALARSWHQARTGVALDSDVLAPRRGLRGAFARLANDLRNLTGTPINVALDTFAAVGLGIAAGCSGGLDGDLNEQANAALATIQFPTFLAMKHISSETRRIYEALARDLDVKVAPDSLPRRAWSGEGFVHPVLRGINVGVRMLSDAAGSPAAAVLGCAGLAALGGAYGALDYDTWLAVFNGVPQCITTPMFDATIWDLNRCSHLYAAITAHMRADAGSGGDAV